jgi:acyl carrier protein
MGIEDQIRDYLGEYVLFSDNGLEYSNDDSFLECGIVDSVAVMELTLFVEEMFGIFVKDQDITPDNFDSVNKLARFIRSRLDSAE